MQQRYHKSEQKFPLLSLEAHYYVSEDHDQPEGKKKLIHMLK